MWQFDFKRSIKLLLLLLSICVHVDGEVVKGINGLDKVVLREARSSAEVILLAFHYACVSSHFFISVVFVIFYPDFRLQEFVND